MSKSALAELQSVCPVKGSSYKSTLAVARKIDSASVATFMSQWYAFSSAIPEILCIAALKASCESERANIVANLYSELGLDSDGTPHPELLKDLIEKATGQTPSPDRITRRTQTFLEGLRQVMLKGSPAYNAGIMLALEAVAYSILAVLKEILEKSGNADLIAHPYIAIHEEIEATHIDNTQKNIEMHKNSSNEVDQGYAEMTVKWLNFWNDNFETLVTKNA